MKSIRVLCVMLCTILTLLIASNIFAQSDFNERIDPSLLHIIREGQIEERTIIVKIKPNELIRKLQVKRGDIENNPFAALTYPARSKMAYESAYLQSARDRLGNLGDICFGKTNYSDNDVKQGPQNNYYLFMNAVLMKVRTVNLYSLSNIEQVAYIYDGEQMYSRQYVSTGEHNQRHFKTSSVGGKEDLSVLYEDWEWESLINQWFYSEERGIKLNELHQLGLRGQGRKVAVLDTGIDVDHDAVSNVWDNEDYEAGKLNVVQYEQFGPWQVMDDTDGHGTHIAGIVWICARDAEFYIGQLPDGTFFSWELIPAIEWAHAVGADVIVTSYGVPDTGDDCEVCNSLVCDAFNDAVDAYTTVVAAAGNDESIYPASPSTAENVVSVSSYKRDGDTELEIDSDHCPQNACLLNMKPDFAAPGEYIKSLYNSDVVNTVIFGGSSFAAPFVAGTALLLRQVESSAALVEEAITVSAHRHDISETDLDGEGRLHAYDAYNYLININNPVEVTLSLSTYNTTPGAIVTASGTATYFNGDPVTAGTVGVFTNEGFWQPSLDSGGNFAVDITASSASGYVTAQVYDDRDGLGGIVNVYLTVQTSQDINVTVSLAPQSATPNQLVSVSGSASYAGGGPVTTGTVVISTIDGSAWNATLSGGGSYQKIIRAPQAAGYVTVTVDDGASSGFSQAYLDIEYGGTSGDGYIYNDSLLCHGVEDVEPYEPIDPTRWFKSTDDYYHLWSEINDVYEQVKFRTKWYKPNGDIYIDFESGWTTDPGDEGFLFYDYWVESLQIPLNGYSNMDEEGMHTVDILVKPEGGSYEKHETEYFFISYDFQDYLMCKDIVDQEFVDITNTFDQTDTWAFSCGRFNDVIESVEFRTEYFEPNGTLYHTSEFTLDDPPDGQYYSVAWLWTVPTLRINGYAAENKCGNWIAKGYEKDHHGNWDLLYEDPFVILESPAVLPTVTMGVSPEAPNETQELIVDLSVSDNTYLQSVDLFWNDGTEQSQAWNNIVSGSFDTTVNLGRYDFGTSIDLYARAIDTSGNIFETAHTVIDIADDQSPEVSISTPGSSSVLEILESAPIAWSATDNIAVAMHKIEYTTNGGQVWHLLLDWTSDNPDNYTWLVPNEPSENCIVRVYARDDAGNVGMDQSSGHFTIHDSQPPTVSLLTPNGGESWGFYTAQDITWSATDNIGIVEHKLDYSTDGGWAWTSIIDWTIDNPQTYEWYIPFTQTQEAMIRIFVKDFAGNITSDQSDDTFFILSSSPSSSYYVSMPPRGNDANAGTSPASPFATIQHAVDVANGTSTMPASIRVSAGLYDERITMDDWEHLLGGYDLIFDKRWDFENNGLHPSSEYETTIDGRSVDSVITVENAGQGVKIDGFTLFNGVSGYHYGAGIECDNASPLITNNTFRRDYLNWGAAICCLNGSDARIHNNDIEGYECGIKSYSYSDPYISNNSISFVQGVGIEVWNADAEISNNTIVECNNSGISVHSWSGAQIRNNLIVDNGNSGIYTSGYSSLIIENNTISGNTADQYGGGIYSGLDSSITVQDTILWGNSAPTGKEIYIDGNYDHPIDYTLIEDWPFSVYLESGSSILWGDSVFDGDPLFTVGPWGDYYLSQVSAGQIADSPCLDYGSDIAQGVSFVTALGTEYMDDYTTQTEQMTDEGQVDFGFHYFPNTAPLATIIAPNGGETLDIGTGYMIRWESVSYKEIDQFRLEFSPDSENYYEDWQVIQDWTAGDPGEYLWTVPDAVSASCRVRILCLDPEGNETEDLSDDDFTIYEDDQVPVLFVAPPPIGSNANSGTTPQGPFSTIQHALDLAKGSPLTPVTIKVAAGTYNENVLLSYPGWESLEGGWTTDFSLRWDFATDGLEPDSNYESTIDGGGIDPCIKFPSQFELDGVRIDGFTVTNGYSEHTTGGGIVCNLAPATIVNNKITQNHGPGIFAYRCSVLITNNLISNNTNSGIKCEPLGYFPHATISGNIISGNTSTYGAGIDCWYGTHTIINNIICGNSATGGVAGYGGGISCGSFCNVTLRNNTISGNFADLEGGGIYLHRRATVDLSNSILWGNSAPIGDEIYVGIENDPSSLNISHSAVDGGQSSVYTDPGSTLNWGAGMLDADPLFASGPRGDYYLSSVSAGQPADSPCLDAGSAPASTICFMDDNGQTCMNELVTRVDQGFDAGTVDLGAHYSVSLLETMTITAPAGGEEWNVGNIENSTWDTDQGVSFVKFKVEYSTDSGDSWQRVQDWTDGNPEIYPWLIPATPSEDCRVRVSGMDGSLNVGYAISAADFAIEDSEAPIVTLSSPNEGDAYCGGVAIQWSGTDNVAINEYKLDYSTDGGSSWLTEQDWTSGNPGDFSWSAPAVESNQCRVRVGCRDASGNQGVAVSGLFSLDCEPPAVTVTEPAGGEIWETGSRQDIRWSTIDTSGLSAYKVDYSVDGGGSWVTLRDWTAGDPGTISWIVPETPSTQCRIRVFGRDGVGQEGGDTCDNNFTILGTGLNEHRYVAPPPLGDDLNLGTLPTEPFASIQQAIDAAHGADNARVTILVAAGTYYESVVLNDWETIQGGWNGDFSARWDYSGAGIEPTAAFETVIDGGGADRCVVAIETESGVAVDGFTIRNGTVEDVGGGIYVFDSDLTITNCKITGNTAANGGGLYVRKGSPSILNNEISENSATGSGAGGYMLDATPTIAGSNITGNVAQGVGGGLCFSSSDPLIWTNRIVGNVSASEGGGIHCEDSNADITDCVIADNTAESGAGLSCWHSFASMVNSIVTGNRAENRGGGVYGQYVSSLVVQNCTLTGNRADTGGGVRLANRCTLEVKDSILLGNIGADGEDLYVGSTSEPSTVNLLFSDLSDGEEALIIESGCSLGLGAGVIYSNPLFAVAADGMFYLSDTNAGQPEDSPCLDAGSTQASNVCFMTRSDLLCMDELTTRTDIVTDSGIVDIGYHHGNGLSVPPLTISSNLTCNPTSGTLPFTTQMSTTLTNFYTGQTRRIAGHVDVQLPNSGPFYANWHAGYTNVAAGSSYNLTWNQTIPAYRLLIGDSVFTLIAEDVTQAPYNQPPYPPSGDTDIDTCTVTGIAP